MHKQIETVKNLKRLRQELQVIKEEIDLAAGRLDKIILYPEYYEDVSKVTDEIKNRVLFTTGIKL